MLKYSKSFGSVSRDALVIDPKIFRRFEMTNTGRTLYCFIPEDGDWRPLLVGEARGIREMAMEHRAETVRRWNSADNRDILVDELPDEGSLVVAQIHDGRDDVQFHIGRRLPFLVCRPDHSNNTPVLFEWWSNDAEATLDTEHRIQISRLLADILEARLADVLATLSPP